MNNYKINRLSYVEFDHEPTADELMHFKYVKREKVHGKWRYYYTNPKTGETKDVLGYGKRDALLRAKRNYKYAEGQASVINKQQNGETRDEVNEANAKKYKAMREVRLAYEAYKKTPLGKVYQAKMKIDDGRAAIGKLFENTAKKLKTPRARV